MTTECVSGLITFLNNQFDCNKKNPKRHSHHYSTVTSLQMIMKLSPAQFRSTTVVDITIIDLTLYES